MDAVILKNQFRLYKNKHCLYEVSLNDKTLCYKLLKSNTTAKVKQNQEVFQESVHDVIGCQLMKSEKPMSLSIVFICIYFYLLSKDKKKRFRKLVTFEVSELNSKEKNLEIARKWRTEIYRIIYKQTGSESLSLFKNLKKKYLVLVNPRSGPGVAFQIFNKKLLPILNEAEIDYELLVTKHSNHSYEFVQNCELFLYSAIIIVSGDGLLYEVYNGLNQRNDNTKALEFPIGIIPGGSGNGLASSISHLVSEPYLSDPVLISSLNIVNPTVSPMDLILVDTLSKNRLVSFLSIGYGILADVDIKSEKLRAIGEARFAIYGVARIFKMRKYRARLSYKIAKELLQKEIEKLSVQKFKLPHSMSYSPNDVHIYDNDSDDKEIFKPNTLNLIDNSDSNFLSNINNRSQKKRHRSEGEGKFVAGSFNVPEQCDNLVFSTEDECLNKISSSTANCFESCGSDKPLKNDLKNSKNEINNFGNSASTSVFEKDKLNTELNNRESKINMLETETNDAEDLKPPALSEFPLSPIDCTTLENSSSLTQSMKNEIEANFEIENGDYHGESADFHVKNECLTNRKSSNEENKQFESEHSDNQNSTRYSDTDFEAALADDWTIIEDEFVSVYAVNAPYISSDSLFSPQSKLDDGVMWLCYLRGDVSRATAFKFMSSIETGTHVNMPEVTHVPVTEFRIEPVTNSGTLTIDGESIPVEPIHAKVLPSKARILTRFKDS